MKVLKWFRRPFRLCGPDRDIFPFEIMILSFVDFGLRQELVDFAEDAYQPYDFYHYKGHQWWFQNQDQVDVFVNHRPMLGTIDKILKSYHPDGSFKPVAWVAVDSSKKGASELIDPDMQDFFWESIEWWITDHCRGEVQASIHPYDDFNPLKKDRGSLLGTRTYFNFELEEDAVLFRMRWN